MRPPGQRAEGPGWWARHGGTAVMVGALLLIFNDPMDRLLPVSAPALVPGPTTTWDPAVVIADGRLDWEAVLAAGRSAVAGSPADAWPKLQAALSAAGLPQAVPEATLSELRAGRRPEPDPAAEARIRAAAEPVFAVLLACDASAVFAVPRQAPSALAQPAAPEALRQLIRAAGQGADQLEAAGRLGALIPVAAGLEDLDGAAMAHRAEAGVWQALIRASAAAPGDAAVRGRISSIRDGVRMPAMPAAQRRARLAALHACTVLNDQVMTRGGSQLRVNHPPDINHALGLLNRWFDQLAAILPGDLADGRALAVLAARNDSIPDLDTADLGDERSLAERMLFDQAVAERRRQTAALLASLVEMQTTISLREALQRARRAALLRAVLHAILAVPERGGAAATAAALTSALPASAAGGAIAFRADGEAVRIELQLGRESETIATIKATGP